MTSPNPAPILVLVDGPAASSTGLCARNVTDTAVSVPQLERRWMVDSREITGAPIIPPGTALEITRAELDTAFADGGNSVLRLEA